MSAIIGTKQYVSYFNNPHGLVQGAIGSALAAGSVVGALFAGPLSDRIDRRDAIFCACLFWLAGTAIQVAYNGYGMLIGGRLINGICEKRGSIIVIQQLAIEWGIFIMLFVGYGCSFIAGPASFRTAWGIQFIPAVILMLGIPFLPRSPRWLAKVGRTKQAIDVLARIQAHGDINDPLVVAEWEEITTVLQAEREALRGWRKFIKKACGDVPSLELSHKHGNNFPARI
ncbi:hypothetical protein OEA41_010356 [Lepraria neglecta]|uniref:Major facilitator superfamily (MFS) profile domain-containing protein n=1 Tax=Lepraria neglecta TaxID=209136 RepID=A0AAE0DFH6_9LECA|nr:hypothetical protein OEA41_010356 [Lepraria neglecta]